MRQRNYLSFGKSIILKKWPSTTNIKWNREPGLARIKQIVFYIAFAKAVKFLENGKVVSVDNPHHISSKDQLAILLIADSLLYFLLENQ